MKKFLIYAGVVVSILLLWLALKDTNWADIKHAFANATLWPMIPMFVCMIGFYWLKAARWRVLLSPTHKIPTRRLVPSMMAGAAGNNLLPAHLGEVVRVYYAGHTLDIPKTTVLATLVLERVFDIITVLALLSIAFFFGEFSDALYKAGALLLLIAICVIAASAVLTFYSEQCVSFIHGKLTFISTGLRETIADQLTNLGAGLASLREGRLYANVIVNSLIQWTLMAGHLYFALVAFNLDVSFLVAIVILGFTVAGLALPTSPGFFGTIEYCFVLGLATVGIDASVAISAAIYYHIPAWLAVTLGGLVIVHFNRLSFRELKANAA